MIDALSISQSGLKATQEWIDHISNNVSNMHTTGYKKTAVYFQDMVAADSQMSQTASTSLNTQSGIGARIAEPMTVFSGGTLKSTFRDLDVAIQGAGMLEVELEDGSLAYTKVGSLRVNDEGTLMNMSGNVLTDQIIVPPDYDRLEINPQGVVTAYFDDDSASIEVGEIHLAHIANPEALTSIGSGLFVTNEKSGEATMMSAGEDGVGELLQGYLESSNVELVDEMTNLVLAQRAYQLNARIIQTADQILETINNLRR